MRIEIVPLVVNIILMGYYVWHGGEIGKVLYWGGVTIATVGLYIMRG